MEKCYSKKLDFLYYKKERQLFGNTKIRIKNGTLYVNEKYLKNLKVFIEKVRTLEYYQEWLNRDDYTLYNNDEELFFGEKRLSYINGRCHKSCAKINKFTKKVDYFDTVTDLVEDMGYDVTWIYKHLSKDKTLDGFYLCYEKEIDEILERLS